MSRVVVFTSLTLDGVMQAPGRPDEDRRGGFEHGGWATPYADPVMWEGMGSAGACCWAAAPTRTSTGQRFIDAWRRIPTSCGSRNS